VSGNLSSSVETGVFPQLKTDRLLLREITLNDVDWYFSQFNKREIVEGSGSPGPKDLDAARSEMELFITGLFKQGRGFRWGIVLREASDLIGSCGFYNWKRDGLRSASMGYDLDPKYWGQGIMAEAVAEIIRFGFEKMNLNRIECTIMPSNARSIRLVERLGFKQEGLLREHSYFNGKFYDDAVFSLLKREWASIHRVCGPEAKL